MSGQTNNLFAVCEVEVRFNDCDPLGIVWHGNYITYLEDARASFGAKYGIGYLDIHANGFVVPIVNINCDYKASLKFGETAIVEIRYIDKKAAKLVFEYSIKRKSDNILILEASSTQVFLDNKNELYLTPPNFFLNWKRKQGLICE